MSDHSPVVLVLKACDSRSRPRAIPKHVLEAERLVELHDALFDARVHDDMEPFDRLVIQTEVSQ